MADFSAYVEEYKIAMRKGAVAKVYRGLLEYMLSLRIFLKNAHSDFSISSNIYSGYMDMTFFSFAPEAFRQRGLKVAIVFLHEAFRFEVWLAGNNRQMQAKFWKLFRESSWDTYPVVPNIVGVDSIVEHILVADPDFRDYDALTKQIERETLRFITDIEEFISS